MIPSTSDDIPPNVPVLGVESDYEDALSSEEELGKLCTSLKAHLVQTSKARKERKMERVIAKQPSTPIINYQRSSSSEHSSLEKLRPGDVISRRGTIRRIGKDSDSDRSDYRLLTAAINDMAHYPLLVQLNEQLREISRQLNDVEATNGLQLKIIMRLLNRVSKPKPSIWQTVICRFFRSFQFFFFAFTWPFITRILYHYYLRYLRIR